MSGRDAELQQWLTIKEAATYLGRSRPTIYDWIRQERLPQPVRKGQLRLLPLAALDKLKPKGERMGERRRNMDVLEEAERRALILRRAGSAEEFPMIGAGGISLLTLFLDRLEALERRIDALERARPAADRPGTTVIGPVG